MTAPDGHTFSSDACSHFRTSAKRGGFWITIARFLCFMASSIVLAVSATSFAQPAKPVSAASAAAKPATAAAAAAAAAPAKLLNSKPVWAELTVQQQTALRPLAVGWDTISEAKKRKWLDISKGYASLTPEGQNIMHGRMKEWAELSAQQRAQARLNFAKTKELSKELTQEEKQAKWQTYQALSAEEKQKLASKASPKTVGAATALKPVSPQKLATIPPAPKPQAAPAAPLKAASMPAVSTNQSGNAVLPDEGMSGNAAANLKKP